MTPTPDFDRRLSDWLEDGPSSAPERSIAAALDHARVNPRRRDPLAALRRDPMGSARFGSGMRTLPLVAALGLLLVAAVAVATVGGVFNRQPVIVPPIESPSVSPSLAPATPSPAPTASPSPVVRRVDLVAFDGRTLSTIEVVDQSGTLEGARTGAPADGGSQSTPDKADVKNNATGVSNKTITNSTGQFAVPALDPGTYTVTVTLQGFKTAIVKDVVLIVGSPGNVPVTLEVGTIGEAIEVNASSSLVQTQSTAV